MKITVKTISGQKFSVEVAADDNVGGIKSKIEAANRDFPAGETKLIHKAKILKNEQTIAEIGLKETDFLVCHRQAPPMASGGARVSSASQSAREGSNTSSTSAPPPTPAPAATPSATATPAPTAATTPSAPQRTAPPQAAAAAAPAPAQPPVNEEHVNYLLEMGLTTDRAQIEAALRAARGNPDVAFEFLTTGIPPEATPAANAMEGAAFAPGAAAPNAAGGGAGGAPTGLARLRQHPQFNQLRQLVQTNPNALQQVLATIGSQDPDLLSIIHANQAEFIEMMNEPITDAGPAAGAAAPGGAPGAAAGAAAGPPGGMLGLDPADLARQIASMPPAIQARLAQEMGLTPQQLAQLPAMISAMPPEQLRNMMMGAAGAAGAGGGMPGQHVIRLTDEEMAAVNGLTEMGFDRNQVAYLAHTIGA